MVHAYLVEGYPVQSTQQCHLGSKEMIEEKIKIEGCLASLDKVTGTGQRCEVLLDRNSTPVSNKRKCL